MGQVKDFCQEGGCTYETDATDTDDAKSGY